MPRGIERKISNNCVHTIGENRDIFALSGLVYAGFAAMWGLPCTGLSKIALMEMAALNLNSGED